LATKIFVKIPRSALYISIVLVVLVVLYILAMKHIEEVFYVEHICPPRLLLYPGGNVTLQELRQVALALEVLLIQEASNYTVQFNFTIPRDAICFIHDPPCGTVEVTIARYSVRQNVTELVVVKKFVFRKVKAVCLDKARKKVYVVLENATLVGEILNKLVLDLFEEKFRELLANLTR